MEQVVGPVRQADRVITQHVQIGRDLGGVLSRPAVHDDGLARGQVLEHLVLGQAFVGCELERAGDMSRYAGFALAQIVIFTEVVDDEVVGQVVLDGIVHDTLETGIEHYGNAGGHDRAGISVQDGEIVNDEIAVGRLCFWIGQVVAGIVSPFLGGTRAPGAHAPLQAVDIGVTHQFHGDLGVTGALAGVAGHHVGFARGDGLAGKVVKQGSQGGMEGPGDVAILEMLRLADVDDRIAGQVIVESLGVQHSGAVARIVDVGRTGFYHGVERAFSWGWGYRIIVVGATSEGHQGDQDQ